VLGYLTSEFRVTNRRVFMKTGFARRKVVGVRIPSVEAIEISQGWVGRMLGFGSIIVRGEGGWQRPFHRIAAPVHFGDCVEGLRRGAPANRERVAA
jgi:uncharacterized membrane protein YdbT with pleckstrin-like domain